MDRVNGALKSYRNQQTPRTSSGIGAGNAGQEKVGAEINLTKQSGEDSWQTNQNRQSVEQSARRQAREALQKSRKEYQESGESIFEQLRKLSEAYKDALDPKNKTNLYDATMDLMLVEQAEKVPALKAIQSRLLFKIRSIKSSGAKTSEIRMAVSKVKKVLGKVKGKVKNLQKEELLEKKRKRAEEARRKAREEALRRELEKRKKLRKIKERNDIEESKMGLGANYGGPSEASPMDFSAAAYGSTGDVLSSVESGAVVDVAVVGMAPGGAGAAAESGGAVDVAV